MKKLIGIGVMLQTSEGKYLLQERDNKAEMHPELIAPFGGGVEKEEDALECAKREMFEELNLVIENKDLETIKMFEVNNDSDSFIHMFLAKDIEKSQLVLNEGRAIMELSKEEALLNKKVTDFTKEVLGLL